MTNAVQNESHSQSQNETGGASVVQKILIGALLLGVAALLAYQFFGCATCYG